MADISLIENSENNFDRVRELQLKEWGKLLYDLDGFRISHDRIPVHSFLKKWVGYGGDNMRNLIQLIRNDQNAARTAKEIQDFAQRCLREKQLKSGDLPGPRIKLFRGIRGETTETATIQPWSSLTTNEDFASTSANPYSLYGWKEGVLLELEVPIENIFTYWEAHPAFEPRQPEQEYILNEKGVKGAALISIDGHLPTKDDALKIKSNMPDIEVVLGDPKSS